MRNLNTFLEKLTYLQKSLSLFLILGLYYWLCYALVAIKNSLTTHTLAQKLPFILISLLPDLGAPIFFGLLVGIILNKILSKQNIQNNPVLKYGIIIIIFIIGFILTYFTRELIWLNIAKPY